MSNALRLLLHVAGLVGLCAVAAEPGWVSLFDGSTLNGWAATNMTYWSVRDGAITASSAVPVTNHSYLIWQGSRPGEFELKATFRIQGNEQANSGIQFRSKVRPDGFVEGYQADIARYAQHCGILYDETPGRGLLAERGQRVVIDDSGRRTAERFADSVSLFERIHLDGWNEYHLVARGPTVAARINGALMWEVTDRDAARHAAAPGVIALQIHSGPAMTVQFKDILLKPLPATAPATPNPFFALCMDTHDSKKRSLREQAELLKELGYDGAGHLWLDQVPERLETLNAAGLKLYQIYIRVDVSSNAPQPYDPRLNQILPLLKGSDTMLAALVTGGKPSDESRDPRAVALLREIADLARPNGVRIALYPHAADWLERVEDALRVTGKTDRENVGVMFNLCHWLRVDKQRDYRALLKRVGPRLFAVSINGADVFDAQPGWSGYIQSLDRGSFDLAALLAALRDLGYAGPIGLQCYGLTGDARDHLARSITAWRKLNGVLSGEKSAQ